MTVTPITLENLDSLGVDEFNRLYWKGEQIATTAMLNLPTWVDWTLGIAAIVTTIHLAMLIAERFERWTG